MKNNELDEILQATILMIGSVFILWMTAMLG